ncbi:hypothetical protein ACFOY4_25080 [Actinomadura syzygii]|uniref:Uncharacterized protein n=1 Tax=Actinomadura syzygii TaxID=1427538 RepID=A0A5D0UJQ3_9ACTN|nr:hypothetical protein [Actinomadura syzygii]TYC18314.1 hypothetical protein FXF65_00650 [Actinomadura syzygii]
MTTRAERCCAAARVEGVGAVRPAGRRPARLRFVSAAARCRSAERARRRAAASAGTVMGGRTAVVDSGPRFVTLTGPPAGLVGPPAVG